MKKEIEKVMFVGIDVGKKKYDAFLRAVELQ
jgi:hypothetical protein